VKALKKLKTLTTISIMLILTIPLIQNATAQTSDKMQTFFSKKYAGISIKFSATQEATPGENITINLWINCTADGINVNYLTLKVYGFRYGQEKIEPPLHSTYVVENITLVFNYTYQYNFTVHIPNNVWGATYAELHVRYAIVDSPFEYNPNFSITIVRNVYLEELENMFKNLNYTHWQLNQIFGECFQMNLTKENIHGLNQTYWELQQNYTSVQGSLIELGNTRMAVIILAITTIFFVATTFYVVMRKPKQYW
jgi:hypothetical protein